MDKKLLVTGFGGFVAGSVISHGTKDWVVHAIDRIEKPSDRERLKYHTCDLRDFESLKNLFDKIKPDAMIHTAAISDIDFCQQNQKLAYDVNVGGTHNLALLCKDSGAKMVLCSTDTVFDGNMGNYSETDDPNPINFYAETKVKAENIIMEILPNGVAARLSLVMGLPVLNAGNSFLARLINKLKSGESVKFPKNEIRSPIDVITLGRALVELAGNNFRGVLHLSGNDQLIRFKMAQRIAERLGYSPELIIPVNSNAIQGRAPRPNDVSLNNSKAKKSWKHR